tara:strand:+ start:343 stop:654 length:312 start_codon:yes stop_codon:yes gene_type:complete
MKIVKKENFNVELGKSGSVSTYIHGWADTVDLDFDDTGVDGVQRSLEVKVPLELARELATALTDSIAAHDVKQAEKELEAAAEEEAAEAERVAEELGVEDVGA